TWWMQQGGAVRAGELRVIPDTVSEIKKLSDTPHDAEWSNAYIASLRAILMSLGVSSSMANDAAMKTYANYKEARASLYSDVVIPYAERRYDRLSRKMGKYYADNPKVMIDKDKVDAIGEDRMVSARRVSMLVKDRIITQRQAAEELGYTYEVEDTAQAQQAEPPPTDTPINEPTETQ